MNEIDVQMMARRFVMDLDLTQVHNDLSVYTNKINAKIAYEELPKGESGYTLVRGTTPRLTINSAESEERQRFTICHEIAHIYLELESSHEEIKSWSFAKRHINEVWCDMFAAELLMPHELFQRDVGEEEPSFEFIQELATKYKTSFPATASRFAALSSRPCAFVTMEGDRIRYASRSTSLRNLNAWIAPKSLIPTGSVSWDAREGKIWESEVKEVSQDLWFTDWVKGSDLYEIARHYENFDQTFALLWFEEEDAPSGLAKGAKRMLNEEEDGLNELTGFIDWVKR